MRATPTPAVAGKIRRTKIHSTTRNGQGGRGIAVKLMSKRPLSLVKSSCARMGSAVLCRRQGEDGSLSRMCEGRKRVLGTWRRSSRVCPYRPPTICSEGRKEVRATWAGSTTTAKMGNNSHASSHTDSTMKTPATVLFRATIARHVCRRCLGCIRTCALSCGVGLS